MNRNEYKKAIEDAVNAIIGKDNPFSYQKNDTKMYSHLEKIGHHDSAVKWAKSLANNITDNQFANYNPQTMVFKLVEELNGQSQKLNAELAKKYEKGQ
jgi:ABC-type Fe3+-citrate transport system substrate-binding protein